MRLNLLLSGTACAVLSAVTIYSSEVSAALNFSSQANSVNGIWAYRSLNNSQDLNADFNSLEFGKGYLVLSEGDKGVITGCIGGPMWQLHISGKSYEEGGKKFLLEGKGIVANEPWQYNYEGLLQKVMTGSKNQAEVISGSVLRVKAHSGGKSPAGVVGSFYAVKITDPRFKPSFECLPE